jgi:hypothetical protein
MSEIDAEKIATELGKRAAEWADTNAALAALEDNGKTILSECMRKINEPTSMAAKEAQARLDPEFREYQKKLSKARYAANHARAKYDTYKAWIELKRTESVNEREAMRLR